MQLHKVFQHEGSNKSAIPAVQLWHTLKNGQQTTLLSKAPAVCFLSCLISHLPLDVGPPRTKRVQRSCWVGCRDLAKKGVGRVFATDALITTLMCAPRSVYSWDIIVERREDFLFFDKRDGSNLNLLTGRLPLLAGA